MHETLAGLLVLDKPSGPTSFDCVSRVRRLLQVKSVGHCGTLDPLAEGVLLLLYGKATSRQADFLELEKQYRFRAEFGCRTETGDREGALVEQKSWVSVRREDLETAMHTFLGEIAQVPHRYSALKFQGKRLYEWARQGKDVPRMPRPVRIHSFELLDFSPPFWEARVVCSRGTYIRSLVEDVAEKLNTVAVLDHLVRERVGAYSQEQALRWSDVCTATREQLLERSVPLPQKAA